MTRDFSAFTQLFEQCAIDASDFGHVDHVGVAHEMLKKYEFLDACMRYSKCIDTIATNAGAAGKFNTTITLAFLSLIAERMKTGTYKDFEDFIDQNPDLLAGNPLAKWYTRERLGSDLAKSVFLMPEPGLGGG